MPLSFEQFKSLRQQGLSTEQIAKFTGGNKQFEFGGGSQNPSGGGGGGWTPLTQQELREEARPDMGAELLKEITTFPSKQQFQEHPVKSFGGALLKGPVAGMKAMGTGMQGGESAIAAPILDVIGGNFKSIPKSIAQSFSGVRKAEFGDIGRKLGLSEPLSATLGLIGMGALTNASMGKKAMALDKMKAGYGKDISKNIIKHTMGLTDDTVEHGMQKGWRNILHKANTNKRTPYNLTLRVKNGLQKFYRNINKSYGDKLDDIALKHDVKVDVQDVIHSLGRRLQEAGILDDTFKPLRGARGKAEAQILRIHDNLIKGAAKGKIGLKDIVKLKQQIWRGVKDSTLKGNQPINASERIVAGLQDDIGQLLANSTEGMGKEAAMKLEKLNRWYGGKRNLFNAGNKVFKTFADDYSTSGGEAVLRSFHSPRTPYGTKLLLNDLEKELSADYRFIEPLKDWLTVQESLVNSGSRGMELHKASMLSNLGKFGFRGAMQTGVPSAIGRNAGQVSDLTLRPALLRQLTGRNQ